MNLANDAIKYSGYGFLYSLAIQTVIYPFEVVKLLQQDPLCNKKCYSIAEEIFRREGCRGFYRGLPSKLVETGHKPLWRWPLMMQLPLFLGRRGYNENQQQALTGISIGVIDALFSTPWDALKLASIYRLQKKFSWHGFSTNIAKRTVEWTTFLVALNHFSNQQQKEKKELNWMQASIVALQTTACVILTRTPFEVANTLKQTGKSLPSKNISRSEQVFHLYRGAPIGFSTLLIYNFFTTIFMNRLKNNF